MTIEDIKVEIAESLWQWRIDATHEKLKVVADNIEQLIDKKIKAAVAEHNDSKSHGPVNW